MNLDQKQMSQTLLNATSHPGNDSMIQTLANRLRPVRTRIRWMRAWRAALGAVLVASVAAVAVAVARSFGWVQGTLRWELFLPPFALLPGAVIGACRRVDWREVARQVDRKYQLKDRTATAWEFAADGAHDELVELQQQDALEHLSDIRVSHVVPGQIPSTLWYACPLWATALLIGMIGYRPVTLAATDSPQVPARKEQQVQLADQLEEDLLSELRKLAELTGTKPPDALALQQTARDVTRQLERMRQPDADEREMLASLSEIQAALEQAKSQFSPQKMESDLKEIAGALSKAQGLEMLPELMTDDKMLQAAELMDDWRPEQLGELERKTLAEDLRELQEEMEAKQSPLAETVESLEEGFETGDSDLIRTAANRVASQMQSAAQRMAIQAELDNQLAGLSEARGRSRSGGNNTAPSDESRETWGQGQAGNPLGDPSNQLTTTRQREQLQGVQGQGPSERTLQSAQRTEGTAERPLQSIETIRGRSAEEVIGGESLPLGQRATVRRYFESLRQAE
jgi:hypothetical protein